MADPRSLFDCPSLGSFSRAFLRLPEVHGYAAGCAAAAAAAVWLTRDALNTLIPVGIIFLLYPLFEYALHRAGLHAVYLCRTPPTARIWWRIHYRHHADPQDASVILAEPLSLVLVVGGGALLAASLWWSPAGFCAALSAGFFVAIAYEYFHSLAHSRVMLTEGYFLTMRQHHIAHHYFDEQSNYGIVTAIADHLFGTVRPPGPERSPTVRNLGYRGEMTTRYPYIERIEEERRLREAAG